MTFHRSEVKVPPSEDATSLLAGGEVTPPTTDHIVRGTRNTAGGATGSKETTPTSDQAPCRLGQDRNNLTIFHVVHHPQFLVRIRTSEVSLIPRLSFLPGPRAWVQGYIYSEGKKKSIVSTQILSCTSNLSNWLLVSICDVPT